MRAVDGAMGQGPHESVHGYGTLAVAFDALAVDPETVRARLQQAVGAATASAALPAARTVTVPVAYGAEAGPDLEAVASAAGLSPGEVVSRHAGQPYRVLFLGFAPGFAYMGEVAASIAAPRLATPRPAVPAGSVGIAGRQTGVYPRATPGGWRLIGRTPLRVYDPARREPALFRQGDEVVFVPLAAAAEFPAETVPDPPDPCGIPALHVVRPGLFTTVQDLGRWGHRADGVGPSGAADPLAARLANRLVGNADGAAVLEATALGPELRALRDIAVAVVGADLAPAVDGVPLAGGTATILRRGSTLAFRGPRAGCRAYVAVGGGVAVQPVLGSRSADPLGGLGPRPLRAGEVLGAYPTEARASEWIGRRLRDGVYALPGSDVEVGLLPGPQSEWFEEDWWGPERSASSASDRVGLRLEGHLARRRDPWAGEELLSEPNVLGAVQVPPDGRPVVLLAGHPTVGGYPKPGVVCTVDAWRLAQAMPGAARIRFTRIDLPQARRRVADVHALLTERDLVLEG